MSINAVDGDRIFRHVAHEYDGSVLSEAAAIVGGQRAEDYGDMVENWSRTARMISAYLGFEVSARQAADLMVIVKLSRSANRAKRDNYVDIAGYAHVAAACAEKESDQ